MYRTFVKGLITEANELTYPENASIAEDNCIIYRKGNRSRRLGIDFEVGGGLSTTVLNTPTNTAVKEYVWENVARKAGLSFLVLQLGTTLTFYDMAASALSGSKKSFSIDLNTYNAPNSVPIASTEVTMVGGRGFLFVGGEAVEPFLCEYDPDLDTLTTQRVYIQIRDFKGLDDGLAPDQEPVTLSDAHRYNLRNQGWLDPSNTGGGSTVTYYNSFGAQATYASATDSVIGAYFTKWARYPANNKQWWIAKDATTGAFDPTIFSTFFFGNNRSPRGHYVVNAFNIDRSGVSGVTGIPVETTTDRPISITFFSGRVWYLAGSSVYYSQVLDDKGKAGFCYQEADPTSEDISELIATDGGVVQIPEMGRGLRIIPAAGGIVVFGTNGIWNISGTASGFSALDISITKVNPIGTTSPNSIVDAEGQIFWWSRVGIQGMSPKTGLFGPVEGVFDRTNITEQTIQSFFTDEIPEDRKPYVKGNYDPITNTIQWLYSADETLPLYGYDHVLNLDLTLQAFYPWSVSKTLGNFITGIFSTPKLNPVDHKTVRPSFTKYLLFSPINTDIDYKYTFGHFSNNTFCDWQGFDGVGEKYLSYVDTGYELFEDAMRAKEANVIYTYFRRTEENYVSDGAGDYTVDKPSSCLFQVRWDWANSQVSNKWSTKREAYRFRRQTPGFTDDDLSFDTGYPIVVSRQKVRGTGKAIQFRFESDKIGHDFDLLGWAINVSGNTLP